jgi:phage repressor protein C with HTH and peptisase S24 domain
MSNIVTQRFIKCLEKLREDNRVRSSRQFAMSLDYLPQSLSEILKGRRDVTIDLIRRAAEVYRVNPAYLFLGEGAMFLSDEDQSGFRMLTVITDIQNEERILHVPEPAQAGYAGEYVQPEMIRDLPSFTLPDFKYKNQTHRSFDVAGDSMEPTLFEGDKVVCSFLEPSLWETGIKNHYVYVVVTRRDVFVKRLVNNIVADRSLELHSDNEFYKAFTIPLGDVREIWYARVKISPFLPSPQKMLERTYSELKELRQIILDQSRTLQTLQATIESLSPNNPTTMQSHHIKGTVSYQDIGPGFWGIIDEHGRKWRPMHIPGALQKNGLRGIFEILEVDEEISIFMWGNAVEIVSYVIDEA